MSRVTKSAPKAAVKTTARRATTATKAPAKPKVTKTADTVPKTRQTKTAAAAVTTLGTPRNSYDAAGMGRRMRAWNPGVSGPNKVLTGLQKIRDRSRDSVRNDWTGSSSVQHWTTNLIGIGILPRIKRIEGDRKTELNDLWDDWSKRADADGVLNFYGLQTLATRSWLESGEVFVRFRPRRYDFGMDVPLQIQLLEADMVPMMDSDSWPGLPSGNKIRSGIELDRSNQRVAYWVYKEHPGDEPTAISPDKLVRIAKSQMLHIFEPKRPSQLRGVPDLSPVLARLRNVLDFDDAVLERQKIGNLFAAFIKQPLNTGFNDGSDPLTGLPIEDESDPMVGLEPGIVHKLLPGEEMQFANPPEAGTTYEDYVRSQNTGVAAGANLPYQLMSGDIREISDRTLRIIINEFRRFAQQRQWQVIIPMMCQPVREYWVDSAVLAGKIRMSESDACKRVEWAPHGWDYIHPVQDVEAKIAEVNAGFRSRDSVIAERGDDPEQVDQERATSQKRADTMGVKPTVPNAAPNQQGQGANQNEPNQQPSNALFMNHVNDSLARLEAVVAAAQAVKSQAPNIEINNNIPPVQVTNQVETPKVEVTNSVEPTPVQVTNQVESPVVQVTNEVQPAPVQVTNQVESPVVQVTNEVQPAEVNVNLPARKTETTVKRDAQGNIVSTTQVEKDL